MKNKIKYAAYTAAGTGLLALNTVTNAIIIDKYKPEASQGSTTNFIVTLDKILTFVVGLLYFVAVVFALYGGFQILTAAGDEEKVKKGKTTLINAVIGLIVIFLASTIVNWIISLSSDTLK